MAKKVMRVKAGRNTGTGEFAITNKSERAARPARSQLTKVNVAPNGGIDEQVMPQLGEIASASRSSQQLRGENERRVIGLTWNINGTKFDYVTRAKLSELRLTAKQRSLLDLVMATFERYQQDRRLLISSIYESAALVLPQWYGDPAVVSVLCCRDGVIVRREQQAGEAVVGNWSHKSIKDLTLTLSEQTVHLTEVIPATLDGYSGARMTLVVREPDGSQRELMSIEHFVVARMSGEDTVQRPGGPVRIVHTIAAGSRNANVATSGCSKTSIGELDEF